MLRNILAEREKELPVVKLGRLLKVAAERKDVISLGPGEPDYLPPECVKQWLETSSWGHTHYSPPGGRRELKHALVKKLRARNSVKVFADNVIVTTGSTEGILMTLLCIMDPGEGVMITDPGFLAYKPAIEILNGMPISITLRQEDGFEPDVDVMKDMIIREKTRAIIINSPCNPTGVVYKRKLLEEIADFAVEEDLLVISDEAYEDFVYGATRHVSMASLNGMKNRVVSLFSFSKSYAMTGFRVGYAVGPERIIKAMEKVHIYTSICAPTISQGAALAALKGERETKDMVREYGRRRKLMMEWLDRLGWEYVKPEGAFYVFPNISRYKRGSMAFAEQMLKKANVAVIPGTDFGAHGEGFIRLSYATDCEKIEEAMKRIQKAVRRL